MARVLVADDDADLRGMLVDALTLAGHQVTGAADGLQALGAIQQREFDVVILDIFMPELGGLDVLAAVRRRHRRTAVIAMSGGADRVATEPLARAAAMGAARTFTKPFDLTEFLGAVNELGAPAPKAPRGRL